MSDDKTLTDILRRIDGRPYREYKEILGHYEFYRFFLYVDHVNRDPFSGPTLIRCRALRGNANYPIELYDTPAKRVALEDAICRLMRNEIRNLGVRERSERGNGEKGDIVPGQLFVDAGGQAVIERTSVRISPYWVEARFEVMLPAQGRNVDGRAAAQLLTKELNRIVEHNLFWEKISHDRVRSFVNCIENQEFIRSKLDEMGLVAFIADGSRLPRGGATDRPLPFAKIVPFKSPDSLRVSIDLPHPAVIEGQQALNTITGMGIPKGVTLITGGSSQGKTTLLNALSMSVYPHVPGDGREYVVTAQDAIRIRSDQGRGVSRVNISPFVERLPGADKTEAYSASATGAAASQAASLMEGIEIGAKLILVDEQDSAPGLLRRDERTQQLVPHENEPVIPLVDRVHELYAKYGASTILALASPGDYLDGANTVVGMFAFEPHDLTAKAKEIVAASPAKRIKEASNELPEIPQRVVLRSGFNSKNKFGTKGKALRYGRDVVDLHSLSQLVEPAQLRTITLALQEIAYEFADDKTSIRELLLRFMEKLDKKGLDSVSPLSKDGKHPGKIARPRIYEIGAVLNRLRGLRIKRLQLKGEKEEPEEIEIEQHHAEQGEEFDIHPSERSESIDAESPESEQIGQ